MSVPLKKNWVLTQDAFDVLLGRLDPNQERAAQHYETIRHGLITFFECRGSTFPEDQADETINRVARRLLEGKEIYAENPAGYFYGVARNVLKESWEASAVSATPLETVPAAAQLTEDPWLAEPARNEKERRLECLERCLATLVSRDRELIREYYRGETSVKIQNRKLLAAKLGIPLNALRIRALRIREKLEDCVDRRLAQSADR